jgi:hypothetical protein
MRRGDLLDACCDPARDPGFVIIFSFLAIRIAAADLALPLLKSEKRRTRSLGAKTLA